VNWQHQARVARLCAALPRGRHVYRMLQKGFGRAGRLDPLQRLPLLAEMARRLLKAGITIEGGKFLEVGTGYVPALPLGLYLVGAASVTTMDLNRMLDVQQTREALRRLVTRRDEVRGLLNGLTEEDALAERLALLEQLCEEPLLCLHRAGIDYQAPADASRTGLPAGSIDCHFSITTLEHIPRPVLGAILDEAERLLRPGGLSIHYIDLSDHFQHQDASIPRIHFLRFTEQEWERLAGTPFAYCNRLRASDYLHLSRERRFEVLDATPGIDATSLSHLRQGFALALPFRSYDSADLCVTELWLSLRKPEARS
jgi:SAM-dependent methyltransferase